MFLVGHSMCSLEGGKRPNGCCVWLNLNQPTSLRRGCVSPHFFFFPPIQSIFISIEVMMTGFKTPKPGGVVCWCRLGVVRGERPCGATGRRLGPIPLETPSRTNLSILALSTFVSFSTIQKPGLRVKLPLCYPA